MHSFVKMKMSRNPSDYKELCREVKLSESNPGALMNRSKISPSVKLQAALFSAPQTQMTI